MTVVLMYRRRSDGMFETNIAVRNALIIEGVKEVHVASVRDLTALIAERSGILMEIPRFLTVPFIFFPSSGGLNKLNI